jgi:hypothetical protein
MRKSSAIILIVSSIIGIGGVVYYFVNKRKIEKE